MFLWLHFARNTTSSLVPGCPIHPGIDHDGSVVRADEEKRMSGKQRISPAEAKPENTLLEGTVRELVFQVRVDVTRLDQARYLARPRGEIVY